MMADTTVEIDLKKIVRRAIGLISVEEGDDPSQTEEDLKAILYSEVDMLVDSLDKKTIKDNAEMELSKDLARELVVNLNGAKEK